MPRRDPARTREQLLRDSVLDQSGTFVVVRFLRDHNTAQQVESRIWGDRTMRGLVSEVQISRGGAGLGWTLRVLIDGEHMMGSEAAQLPEILRRIVRLDDIVDGYSGS